MNDAQKVIAHVLAKMGDRVYATRLVKLVYLIDYLYSEHFGKTVTGFTYQWDHFGPKAVQHAIITEAEQLVKNGVVSESREIGLNGRKSRLFRLVEGSDLPDLDPAVELVIDDILSQFGKLELRKLVAASKKTEPFRTASQYDILELPRIDTVSKTTKADRKAHQEELRQYGTQSLEEIKKALGVRE